MSHPHARIRWRLALGVAASLLVLVWLAAVSVPDVARRV